ncbi:MAG: RHS repeat protein, partial [Verrucomicrobia bacterium]|nr:RHS repeat protein [Verrucomicrobiota bacterium]
MRGARASAIRPDCSEAAGRRIRVVYADGATRSYVYNPAGQLVQETDPDGVLTLYQYDAQGRRWQTCLDVNGNGQVDLTGKDRITEIETACQDGSTYGLSNIAVRLTQTYVYPDTNSTARILLSTQVQDGSGRFTRTQRYQQPGVP